MELRLEQRHGIPVSRCRAKKKKKTLGGDHSGCLFFFKKTATTLFLEAGVCVGRGLGVRTKVDFIFVVGNQRIDD